jgi:hypothetical protein
MPDMVIRCHMCGASFSSGIFVGPATTVHLRDNRSECPRCGFMAPIPDGTLRATVRGFVRALLDRDDIDSAEHGVADLHQSLQNVKTEEDLARLRSSYRQLERWLPTRWRRSQHTW